MRTIEQLNAKLDQFDRDLDRLFSELSTYNEEVLRQPPAPGVWSPIQVLLHLYKTESMSLVYLRKKLSYHPDLPRAGIGAGIRSRLLILFLKASIKFKAPGAVSADSLPSHLSWNQLQEQWKQTREELRSFINQLDEVWLDRQVYRHPLAGRLSLHQMFAFLQEHFARHRRQIRQRLPRKD